MFIIEEMFCIYLKDLGGIDYEKFVECINVCLECV